MSQKIKVLAITSDDLSLILQIHMAEGVWLEKLRVDQGSFGQRIADVLKQKQPGFSVAKFKTGTESCLLWVPPASGMPLFRQSLTI